MHFVLSDCSFAETKIDSHEGFWKDFEKIFERFGQMLEERKPYLDRRCSFVSICSELGVDPGDFGSFVFSRVGFTGEEVLEIYRRSETEQVFP